MNEPTPIIPPAIRRNHWMNHIRTQASRQPDAPMLKFLGETTSWSQMVDAMERISAALARRGVTAGDRVLLLTLNHPQTLMSIFAINNLGAIAVPVNVRMTPEEVAYIVEDSGADLVIVDAPLSPLALAAANHTTRTPTVIVNGESTHGNETLADLLAEDPGDFVAPDVTEDTTCLLMYTSGTTGRPKGAMLDHANMLAQSMTLVQLFEIRTDDVGFLTAPLFHIAGIGSIAVYFNVGVPTVIHPLGAFDPAEVVASWERERATHVFNVPQQWQLICALPDLAERNLALRVTSWGAAPASSTVLEAMAKAFPDAMNIAVFGQTEMSPITCALRGEDAVRKIGSVGKAIPTIEYRIFDEDMNDVADGEVGEIVYRGPTMMKGYWNKPEATAEAFAGGWFHSGDLVKQDDEGFIWVVDRRKDMIISGGENIYCPEVEDVLFSHPDVLDVAVFGAPSERWGEVPVAAVVTRAGVTLEVEELRVWLSDKLARFKHPTALKHYEEIPRNAGGKVNKVALRQQLAEEG